jgi:hypothetical protein
MGVVTGFALVSAALVGASPGWAAQTPSGGTATATGSDDVGRLRQELDTLRQEYGARMTALETRLAAIEGAAGPTAAPVPTSGPPGSTPEQPATLEPAQPTAAMPVGTAGEGGPGGALPLYGGASAAASKVFNPDIAAIGDFIGVVGRTPGGGEPALQMHESELSFQAVVDPYARADFFLTFGPDEVGVEEAFITFPALPGGFLLRAGKMRDAFGKVDAQHNHVLPFVDRPLVSKNLLGGEDALADAGISVARLIPNPWLFLEATGQVFRGDSGVFKADKRTDLAYVGHLRAYQDLSESTNLDLGGSIAYGHNDAGPGFTTRLLGVDATLRYRPLRRSIYTHLLARGELVWSRREQPGLGTSTAGSDILAAAGDAHALGGYAYLEYQFARRWFAGVRYDDSERATNAGLRDRGGSFILTYWPSEFSQLRAQFRHTRFAEDRTANELLFQFLFAIGAHGAHAF